MAFTIIIVLGNDINNIIYNDKNNNNIKNNIIFYNSNNNNIM